MSRNLLRWLRRTRMDKSMIWKNYYKQRLQELRESLPQCGRLHTGMGYITYLQIRLTFGDSIYYYVRSDDTRKYVPINKYDLSSHYYVESIRFEFPKSNLRYGEIKCYCHRNHVLTPVVKVPALDFRMSIKSWSPEEVRDLVEILPRFFMKWDEEIKLLNNEIPKTEKLQAMRVLRSESVGMRKIKSYVESRYQGRCKKNGSEVEVVVPMSGGRYLTIATQFVYYYPNWWERTLEILDAFVGYYEWQIKENQLDWMPACHQLISIDGLHWYERLYLSEVHREDLVALTAHKKWRKWMPMTVMIA